MTFRHSLPFPAITFFFHLKTTGLAARCCSASFMVIVIASVSIDKSDLSHGKNILVTAPKAGCESSNELNCKYLHVDDFSSIRSP